ncbi:type IX secretion system protein PorD [Aquimarina sp. 2304DJ70-9]|uniref:type IX secretion system protein PorD n=1 Tax=Aquimarina penaris TaxID=3231044 RepID=UPI003461E94E
MYRFLLVIVLIFGFNLNAQEFNAQVAINAEQTGNPNLQVFKTLERSLTEFVNNTKWTNVDYRTEERIDCSFFITIATYDNDDFSATVQVQASRPVFGSNYATTIFNVNDKQFNFNYLEFQPLNYNPNSYESNLISVIAFYLYTILGVDADSFELNGGGKYFEEAKNIVGNAQGSNTLGWNAQDGTQSRFRLNDDLLSGTFDGYRSAMYTYHREGLDVMHNNLKQGKETITKAMNSLQEMHNRRPNSYLMRVFFDAKADEISSVLSGGPSVSIAETVQILNKIAPTYTENWKNIKF